MRMCPIILVGSLLTLILLVNTLTLITLWL